VGGAYFRALSERKQNERDDIRCRYQDLPMLFSGRSEDAERMTYLCFDSVYDPTYFMIQGFNIDA
jgi:hypothetical protein